MDLALQLLERYRDDYREPDAAGELYDYTGILAEELLLHGHPVASCRGAGSVYRYRRSLLWLMKSCRRAGRRCPRDYRREIERELRMTMVVLAGYWHACRHVYQKRIEETTDPAIKRRLMDIYAAMTEAAVKLHAYLEPCLNAQTQELRRECWRARIQLALEGAKNPMLIDELLNMKKLPWEARAGP